MAALIALDITQEIEAAAEAALVDDIRLVTILSDAAIAPGMGLSDPGTARWKSAAGIETSVISARNAAIDPHGAAVAGQSAEEGGSETVIESATGTAAPKGTERDIEIGTVIAILTEIASGPDPANEITTGAALIVAEIEVEIGIVVVTVIALDELVTLDLPHTDAHAHDLAIDIAVGSATVHVHDLLLLDNAPVLGQTRGGGHGLVADHPHDGLLPAL